MKIDKIDRKILEELEENCRKTNSEIAKNLKTSQQVISYRIKQLEEKKIIGRYCTIINFPMLGYTGYRVLIRLGNINKSAYEEMINHLMKHTNVLWIVECGGKWDLLVNFMADNSVKFTNMLREFRNKFKTQIQNYDILVHVEGILFGRSHLADKQKVIGKNASFGGELMQAEYDIIDLKILNLLSENARMNVVDIASKTDISINTIISHIKRMRENHLIQKFIPLVHLENISVSAYKALIKMQNITEEKEKESIAYLATQKPVLAVIKLIGAWDFEIEFEVNSKEEMLEFTRTFRDKFKDIIKEFELLPLFHEYRYNYFPGDILLRNKD